MNSSPVRSDAIFCIEIDFQKGSESPSRVFRTMTELIETFQEFDVDLVHSIDTSIQPIAIIEDIEAGSVKAWLGIILKTTDDDAIKQLDWRPLIGKYLVRAKYLVLKYIDGKTEITTKQEVEELENLLLQEAKETDVTHIPAYLPVNRKKLLFNVEKITKSLSYLDDNDKAIYITAKDKVTMNAKFSFVPDKIQDLITRETLKSQTEMILRVKKPDYLGESKWDFRHETKIITAKILDAEWLKRFQARSIDVRPGDSIRAEVVTSVMYGYDNEVIDTHYTLIRIIEVIRDTRLEQLPLKPLNPTKVDSS